MRAVLLPVTVGVVAGIVVVGAGLALLDSAVQAVAWLMGDDHD